jgi:hypothetical protein
VITWNALQARSTSKSEDLPAILANLMDFNAYQIMSVSSPEERMMAMLSGLPSLPMSLLYNTGPRMRHDKHDSNRWVPTLPSSERLTIDPAMSFNSDKTGLRMEHGGPTDSRTSVILVKPCVPFCSVINILDRLTGREYEVKFCRSEDDELDMNQFQATCIILERTSSVAGAATDVNLRGACLHVYRPEFTKSDVTYPSLNHVLTSGGFYHLSTMYDCP